MLSGFLFDQVIREGRLTVIDASGRRHTYGDGKGSRAAIRLHSRRLHHSLLFNPELQIGEAYMDGTLTIEEGTLYDFVDLCAVNMMSYGLPAGARLSRTLRWLFRRYRQYNPAERARRNAAHHYDLSGQLYDLFLDNDRQYSCAYFASGAESLEEAQAAKKRHVAAKLLLRPRQTVLDIGSGWGGLALYLARQGEVDVTGVTLSSQQAAESTRRAGIAGLSDRVRFHLRDYREVSGRFDRIVSIGMFEHVGVRHFREFFAKLRDLLTDDGVALLHSIGRSDGPGSTSPWINKYIFPGGYSPALSEVLAVVEQTGLWVTDIEILRLHYADTLREWRRRFALRRDEVRAIYDERFCRMWELYLAGAEIAFRSQGLMVFQMQLARRQDAVPRTRDYIVEWERAQSSPASLAA